MESWGLARDAITYSAVISALSKGRQWSLAIDVFNHMWGRAGGGGRGVAGREGKGGEGASEHWWLVVLALRFGAARVFGVRVSN